MGYLSRGPGLNVFVPPPAAKSLDYTQLNDATTAALAAYRNKIINGGLRVNQRGFNTTVNGAYGSDRWRFDYNTTFNGKLAMNVSPTDLVFSDYGQGYFYFSTLGTVPATSGGDYAYILQQIEGNNVSEFMFGNATMAQPVTLSFKAVCNGINGFAFSAMLRNGDSNRSYAKLCQLGASGVATKFKLTIPGDTTGTWKTDNTTGVLVGFTASVGTTYRAAADGVWSAGNFIAAPGQQNLCAVHPSSLVITDVQLERGTIATPFEVRPHALEMLLCRRYWGQSYDYGTPPGTVVASPYTVYFESAGNNSWHGINVTHPVEMRATPTITAYSSGTGASGMYRDTNNNVDRSVAVSGNNSKAFTMVANGNGFGGSGGAFHWTANAEMV